MSCAFVRPVIFFLLAAGCVGGALAGAEIKKTSLPLPPNPEDFNHIQISLLEGAPEITLATSSPYLVRDDQGRLLFRGERLVAARIQPHQRGIQFGSQTFPHSPLLIQSEGEGIRIGDRLYRHAVKIWREGDGKLLVVNEIAVDDYLKGVLPWEANPKWPKEALMAQAIASRTYALFKALENQKEKFVLSKDVLSQVYGGRNSENPMTTQAVEATAGKILTYNGKIFPAYFHSTCGGATTHAEYQWDVEKHPALQGVDCEFCRPSKYFRWQERFQVEEIESRLRKRGISLSGIQEIRPVDRDASGRARHFEIKSEKDKTKIHANDFRLWLDPARLKSTLIQSIHPENGNFLFRGRGWGHGVGMCQYGMKKLAELGYTHEQILKYYYPGAEIISFAPVAQLDRA